MANNIRQLVENPHKLYIENINAWSFYLQSYEGGKDYTGADVQSHQLSGNNIPVFVNGKRLKSTIQGNLFQHPKERDEDFRRRLQRSYYYNFCAPIVDIYNNHLFKDTIITDFDTIERTMDFRSDNVDLQGSNILEFRKNLSELAQIYGHAFVLVDSPKYQNEQTFQDQINNNSFPYLCILHPQQVINWSLDAFGRPYWVLIAEEMDNNKDPMKYNKDNTQVMQYRLFTRDTWAVYDNDYNLVEEGAHPLGMVPIAAFFDKKSKKYKSFLGISKLSDISFIARDVFNLCSELGQIIQDQTFAFLALQGNSSDYSAVEIGTNKGLIYPDDKNPPQYISPPPANAQVLMDQINTQISKIFQLASLEPGSLDFKGDKAVQQSGASKAWDFNQTNSKLVTMASNMEDGEMRMWDLFARWEGNTNWQGRIEYPKDFNVKSLQQDLEDAEKTMKMNIGKSFNSMIKKSIVTKKFPRLSEEDKDEIFEQIENAPEQANGGGLFNRLNINNVTNGNNGGVNNVGRN